MKNTKALPFYSRTFLINKRMQLTFLMYSVFLAMVVSVTNFCFQLLMANSETVPTPIDLSVVALSMMFIFTVVIFFGLYLTNRIAGPLFRLQRHMESVASGQTTEPLAFRKKDYFSDIIEPYNKILQRLQNQSVPERK
ncbi:MAG: hypothetical protein AB7N80_09765 [Bdellovibrionales bacterium]